MFSSVLGIILIAIRLLIETSDTIRWFNAANALQMMEIINFMVVSSQTMTIGWDYSYALYILANLYLAGYCTPEEALDASLNIAETIQANFF